jgi:putative transposase
MRYNLFMKRLQAFKYELMPNGKQQRFMRRFAGARRFVFNKALALQKAHYEAGGKFIGYVAMAKLLTGWRNGVETPWLKDAPVHPLQHALKDLDRAYQNFFEKRADFPRFKKKGQSDSFRYPDSKQFKIDQPNNHLFLPKLGWIRYRNSRDILGAPKNITVSCVAGKWYASIQTEREVEQPVHPATRIVGIDLGITRFATLSDGSPIEPLNGFKKHEVRLARCQRAMSGKTKYSRNWIKAKARVQKIHTRIGNVRRDFLHKLTTTISQNHAIVCIEDLQVLNMSRSAAGSVEKPGRSVRAKSGLNKSLLDQGWGEFRRQLEYKQGWLGGDVLAVPPHNTSRTCPVCGHVSADNRQTQARFACVECGYENHADLVGAINVLNRGMKMLEGQDTADASAGRKTAARIACEVNGAARPSATGTHRSDLVYGLMPVPSAVGIPVL